ncbi:alpha/beta fold hydrolase [Paraburkholderia sacchari]|uniref:alpha/beta fold hydrolase n=1 Tax=Paraburkholderia sacchari TaxID=159450 RepID=UPI003D963B6E
MATIRLANSPVIVTNQFLETLAPSNAPQTAVRDFGGNGSLMLMLHGSGRPSADWHPAVRALVEHAHVVTMDL